MQEFNQFDIVILIVLTFGIVVGFFKGFVAQLFGIVGFFIATWLSFKFYKSVEIIVGSLNIVAKSFTSLVALVLTFSIAFFSIKLASRFTYKIIRKLGLGFINRLGGAFLGLVLSLLLCSSFLSYASPIIDLGFKETKDESKIIPLLMESTEKIKHYIFGTEA